MLPSSEYLELCDAVYCGTWLLVFRIIITSLSQDILKMEVVCYSETLAHTYRVTHNPEVSSKDFLL